jgi:two-component system OmpR family sensor kinase
MIRSIQRRLLISLLGVLLIGAVITALAVFYEARDEANVLFDYQLRQIAQSLPAELLHSDGASHSPVGDDADGVVVQIFNLNGQRLYQSRPSADLPNRIALGFATQPSGSGNWRVYSALFVDNVIEVAQPMRVRNELAAAVALRTAAPLIILVPVLSILLWVTVGRGLAPLRDLARAVSRRSAEALEPLQNERLPREVVPLVEEINLLLQRVKNALAAQRDFIADAAHELRTPVTAVDLQLQLAERAQDLSSMREALLPLRAGIARSQRLIEQLLTLARSQPEASPLELIRFDLQQLLEELLAELAPFALRRGIELELAGHAPLEFLGDREGLRVAVANLVDNAIRYTPSGGQVRVFLDPQIDCIDIVVEDNGPGLSDQDRPRVFDRFYRGSNTTETGSGLGLSIVEGMVARHGGHIQLNHRKEGPGLVAVISLPVTGPAASARRPLESP